MALRSGSGRTGSKKESRRGTWSATEDQIIVDSIKKGIAKWSDIGKMIPHERTGKQCRERWFNHLDPQLKKEPWTEEEDRALLHHQLRIGNSWTKIAMEMPGRSENEVKNRWYSAAIRNRKHKTEFCRGKMRQIEAVDFSRETNEMRSRDREDRRDVPELTPLRLPSLFRSACSNSDLHGQFLQAPVSTDSNTQSGDLTSPESTQMLLLQGELPSMHSGLTTPLSFLGGMLSAFTSGAASPTWYDSNNVGIGSGSISYSSSYYMTGDHGNAEQEQERKRAQEQDRSSSGSIGSSGSSGSSGEMGGMHYHSSGDSVSNALNLLLQGITSGKEGTSSTTTAQNNAP